MEHKAAVAFDEAAAVVTAAILVDVVVPLVVIHPMGQRSASLAKWYRTFGASAVAMDVLSMTWGTLPAFSLSRSLGVRVLVAVLIQMVHDVAFAVVVRRYAGSNRLLALFNEYAEEHGRWILLIDAIMMVLTVVVAHTTLRRLTPRALSTVAAASAYSLFFSASCF